MLSSPHSPPVVRTITGNTGNTIVGAIRWDAWHHQTADGVRVAIETSLGPSKYHWRLPFFGIEAGADTVTVSGNQASIDADIAYAVEAGLDYWAFLWYGKTDAMMQAWQYFQSSPDKNNINWCLMFSGYTRLVADVTSNISDLVGYVQQSNYQKVLGGRPLVYILNDGSSKTGLATAVTDLRSAFVTAGAGDPYIVHNVFGLPSVAQASELATYGFDALSKYTWGPSVSQPAPYSVLESALTKIWDEYTKLSVDAVPIGVTGWDRRPRVENPVPWETPNGTVSDYYFPERMSDISVQLDRLLKWVRANPSRVPSNTVLLYAWNEHDEGGWISPTKTAGGLNRSRVDALAAVLTS